MKLIVEPNFFSNIILNIGLYYALESSGLQTKLFSSYRNWWPTRIGIHCIPRVRIFSPMNRACSNISVSITIISNFQISEINMNSFWEGPFEFAENELKWVGWNLSYEIEFSYLKNSTRPHFWSFIGCSSKARVLSGKRSLNDWPNNLSDGSSATRIVSPRSCQRSGHWLAPTPVKC